jgi:hypothetical protein
MPQSQSQMDKKYPFTKRCKDAGIARLTPPDTWFTDRGVPIPASKPGKVEVFAAHAWALGCCDFADEAKTAAGWNLALSRDERTYLYTVCRHPVPNGGRETRTARAIRLLQAFPPRPASPPPTAAGGGSAPSAPASPPAGGSNPHASPSSPRAKMRKLLATFSPATAAALWASGPGGLATSGPAPGSAASALTGASPLTATTLSGGALGLGSSAPPTGASTPSLTPGAGLGPAIGASPAARRGLFSSPSSQSAGLGLGTAAPPMTLTYGEVMSRLGAAETRFNLTGGDDWSTDDRKRYRDKATDVVVNSGAAVAQGWVAKPPYSLLVDILAPAAQNSTSVDESTRLGVLLARAARWRDVNVDPEDLASDVAERMTKITIKWRAYCEVSIHTPLAASTRLPGLKRIVMAYFQDRLDDLLPALRAAGLGELAPFIEAQYGGLPKLFTDMENRVAALADRCHGEAARASATNTEWMMFYHPFFQGIFRVDGTELAPARAAAALALATAALSAGGAPAAPPHYSPPPPPSYYAPQAALAHPTPGAPYFAPTAPLPPPPGPPPPRLAAGAPTSLSAAFGVGAAAAGQAGAARSAKRFGPVCLPCSAEIIGPQLAVWPSPPSGLICRSCPSRAHAHFECPARYAAKLGFPCPGFDAAGSRVPGDWSGPDLQRATRSAWTTYASRHGLPLGPGAPGAPRF